MADKTLEAVTAIFAAVIGLAVVAVLVSRGSQTSNVISSTGSALSGLISAAVGPAMGGTGLP